MSVKYRFLVIFGVLIILAAGGIFAWQYFGGQKIEIKDETADWKTYSDNESGFFIKYPTNWGAYDSKTGPCAGVFGYMVGYGTVLINRPEKVDSKNCLETPEGSTLHGGPDLKISVSALAPLPTTNPFGTSNPITIDGENGVIEIVTEKEKMLREPFAAIHVNHQMRRFDLYFPNTDYSGNHDAIFDQILSTFKFTDQTANWKTYTNTIYGYVLKYPENFYFEESSGGVSFNDAQLEQDKGYILPIWISIIESALSIQEWLDQKGTSQGWNTPISYAYLFVQDIKENRINNIPVLQFQSSAASSTMYHTLIKGPNPALIFDIVRGWNSLGSIPVETYNEMLPTLKFTDPAANWKTYTNTTYGFSIKFPDTYEVPPQSSREISQLGKDSQACIESKADGICRVVFYVVDNPQGLSASEYVRTLPEIPLNDYLRQAQPVIFNGYAALTWSTSNAIGYMVGNINGTTIVEIRASDNTSILKQILSTFKFTQ